MVRKQSVKLMQNMISNTTTHPPPPGGGGGGQEWYQGIRLVFVDNHRRFSGTLKGLL